MKFWQVVSLAVATVATPVPSIGDYARMLKERSVSVSSNDLANFKFYSEHAGAAYCNFDTPAGSPVTCSSGVCPDVHATVSASFTGPVTGIGAYVSVDDSRKEIVLSVRGSNNIRNFLTDVVFLFTPCNLVSQCQVHAGFAAAWAEIASAATRALNQARSAHPNYKVIATGHSLGGAVAILGGATLRKQGIPLDIYTYGAPRVGNDVFANFVNGQAGGEFRVTHTDDPVPRLPPIVFGYRHVSPEYWLATGFSTTTNYGLGDIAVCTGIANINCNGGTLGLDIIAHLNYFRSISGCSGFPLQFKRDETSGNETVDQELIDRFNQWSQADQAFVQGVSQA